MEKIEVTAEVRQVSQTAIEVWERGVIIIHTLANGVVGAAAWLLYFAGLVLRGAGVLLFTLGNEVLKLKVKNHDKPSRS